MVAALPLSARHTVCLQFDGSMSMCEMQLLVMVMRGPFLLLLAPTLTLLRKRLGCTLLKPVEQSFVMLWTGHTQLLGPSCRFRVLE